MGLDARALNFAAVDDLGFAGAKGRLGNLPPGLHFTGDLLGPLLELRHLQRSGTVASAPTWLDPAALGDLWQALDGSQRVWYGAPERAHALMKLTAESQPLEWTDFAMSLKRAGIAAGLSGDWAAQMTAAVREMESNIHEHSGAPATGMLAYRSVPGVFEFVVADLGLGVLATLREGADYSNLTDHAEALRIALTDGASRLGAGQGRGYGFHELFVGLANRQASLRFRSGPAALTMDGTRPTLLHAQVASKAPLKGFFVSVTCRITPMEFRANRSDIR
jgi:hypothetical protein